MAQAAGKPFLLTAVTGDGQTTGLNQPFPQQLVVRLTDPNGNPLGGAHIYFENAPCIHLLGSPCEFPGAPGHFASGADNATVATNAAGVAISPTYYAGGSLGIPGSGIGSPGAIGVTAYVVSNEAPYFFSIPAVLTYYVQFRLNEVALAQSTVAVPSLSFPLLGALCLLLGIGAVMRLRTSGRR